MNKYVCVHGHFYQPPRENPWLDEVEVQDSAYPYHDWNERISYECYTPNTASRLMDSDRRIKELVDNYRLISFNFGPTLLSWMERHAPETHAAIVESDRLSRADRSGHGNAIAQVYNHIIMPLATRRDKVTQILWGVKDFQRRFGRDPEGLWLAETAVDTETLEIMAEMGLKFTILSPDQARRVRPLGGTEGSWMDVSGGRVDPSRPYRWISPRGLTVDIFFYDSPISRAVAFEGILANGENFAGRLLNGFSADRLHAQLVNVSTDGESYGHHHQFGDMALSYALRKIQRENVAVLTNYGEFLAMHPSTQEVEFHEASSWSCSHGVGRWMTDCGCRIGFNSQWNQKWRAPLRAGLNQLRDDLDRFYEEGTEGVLKDPWVARNRYIDVMNHRDDKTLGAFFEENQARPLNGVERARVLKWMEVQRHRQFMFTSCGWFFDEISGLEGVAIMQYAARAIHLAQELVGANRLEEDLLSVLATAKSNIPELGDGATVYKRYVKPAHTSLSRVAAHHVMRDHFQEENPRGDIYCYTYEVLDRSKESAQGLTLTQGSVRVASSVTGEAVDFAYAVAHNSGHELFCGVAPLDAAAKGQARADLAETIKRGKPEEMKNALERHFGPTLYTLRDLLLEDRRRILGFVIEDVMGQFDGTYRKLVNENRSLMDYLVQADFHMPTAFRLAMNYVFEEDARKAIQAFHEDDGEMKTLAAVQREARRFGVQLDFEPLAERVRERVEKHLEVLSVGASPQEARAILKLLEFAEELGVKLRLWKSENLFYKLWNERLKNTLDLEHPQNPHTEPFVKLVERFRIRR